MDETFQLRANRLLRTRQAAALDFSTLTATLAAERSARAAAIGIQRTPEAAAPAPGDPLTELLLAGPGWREAFCAQHGCFNRAEVKRRRNTP